MATKTASKNGDLDALSNTSNDAMATIDMERPYRVEVELEGTSPILFHRWSCEAIAEKAAAKKGSKAKKTDDVESYVWRNQEGEICIPTEYVRMAIVMTAKMHQDPRSPRKSAMDLFKAGIIGLTDLCSTGKKDWDYLDQRRVQVQRNGITRVRPAMFEGWKTLHIFMVQLPHYIGPQFFQSVLVDAGRLTGVGDFRPTFGRFAVTRYEILSDDD